MNWLLLSRVMMLVAFGVLIGAQARMNTKWSQRSS